MTYDQWKLATPPEYEWPTGPDADFNAEDRSRIDDMMQTAKTASDWRAICVLAKAIGDEPPITTRHSIGPWPPDQDWHAYRPDYDSGALMGTGTTELEAIADLLEQEDAR